jgi:hypothetical protein
MRDLWIDGIERKLKKIKKVQDKTKTKKSLVNPDGA